MYTKGFSTLEILIAFAIMSIVFSGVLLADSGGTYWAVASQRGSDGLYRAKAQLDTLRALSHIDLYAASSTPPVWDGNTSLESRITEISPCSIYIEAIASWRVPGYATSTTALTSAVGNPKEAIKLGDDCAPLPPQGAWSGIVASTTGIFSPGNPTALDVFAGVAYISANQSPYLKIYKGGFVSYTNNFHASDPINALDVVRDDASGNIYAYAAVASTTGQLMVINVTDSANLVEVARITLAGVDPKGSSPQGWRLAYYDHMVYITTRNTAGPEFHLINVTNPKAPVEVGSGLNLGTSPYAILVRDEQSAGATKRFAYLATTLDTGEVMVLDVTGTPTLVTTFNLPDTGCGLSDKPDGSALFASGHTLYVGRGHSVGSCPALADLYTLDISDPLHPILKASGIAGGGVVGLRASGGNLFVYASTQASPTDTGLFDVYGNDVYTAQHAGKELQVWNADPSQFLKRSTMPLTSASLQVFESQV